MIQFQNESVEVEVVNMGTTLLLTWKGFIPSAKYREALDKSLDIAKKNKIHNWISDIRQMKVIGPKDQEWAGAEWTPKAVSAGCYKKQAVIMSEDVFGQASAKNILMTVGNQKVEIQNFMRREDAIGWLANS